MDLNQITIGSTDLARSEEFYATLGLLLIVSLDDVVADLRAEIHRSDAVVVSSPEYAGALPGSFKNLLDWTIGDDQPGSMYDELKGR